MPTEFTEDCQRERLRFQAAHNSWVQALDAVRAAREARHLAQRRSDEANRALREATEERTRAETAWDNQIAAISADPTFGANVDADFVPQSTGSGQFTAIIGPFPLSNDSRNILRGAGDQQGLSAWQAAGDTALTETVRLAQEAEQARVEEAAREQVAQDAEQALDQAIRAFTAAEAARDQAKDALDTAKAAVDSECDGQTRTQPLDGGELVVEPGILPEDEARVTDKLDDIPDNQVDGLGGVTLLDEDGRQHVYLDPNDGTEVTIKVAGFYVNGHITIYVGSGPSIPHVEATIKHELGHHVYSTRLPLPDVQDRWDRFWNDGDNRLKSPRGKMPTGYAGQSASEGFAEVYEYYHDYPDRLDPDTRREIEEILRLIP